MWTLLSMRDLFISAIHFEADFSVLSRLIITASGSLPLVAAALERACARGGQIFDAALAVPLSLLWFRCGLKARRRRAKLPLQMSLPTTFAGTFAGIF